MDITASTFKELRDRTGLGMMECKKALNESDGDIEKAIVILRKKGFARAEGKMSRETADGMVGSYIHMNGKIGVLVEVNCESDFVSRNDEFQEMVKIINLSQLLTETDAPYLSPFKDKRNEPAFIAESIKKIAELKQMNEEEIANNIFMNYQKIF